jgi:hypothetical protein
MTRPARWKVLAFAAALTGLGMTGAATATAGGGSSHFRLPAVVPVADVICQTPVAGSGINSRNRIPDLGNGKRTDNWGKSR